MAITRSTVQFHFHLIYFPSFRTMKMYSGTDDFLHLDGNAVRNLNLVPLIDGGGHQAEGSLFGVLNRTRTKFGTR